MIYVNKQDSSPIIPPLNYKVTFNLRFAVGYNFLCEILDGRKKGASPVNRV